MNLSTVTIVVVTTNLITAIIAAMLLMLVLWQAPRQRYNQLFALTMLGLGAYSVANALVRFIDDLGLDPEQMNYAAITLYPVFAVSFFFFASEFAQYHTATTRAVRALGTILIPAQVYFLWTGQLLTNLQPTETNDGGYQGEWTTLGLLVAATLAVYLVVATGVLFRAEDPRGRALWPAPLLMIGQVFAAVVIWPLIPVPLSVVFMALAALAMGLPVLRYQLFNPLAQLHADLADRHRELQEASHLKSQFLANMSHELRTPLNSIIGYTQLVTNGTYGTLNDVQRDRLDKVIRNGYNLLGLINDVLDLSRIETGRVSLELAVLETPPLIESALATVEPQAQQKGLAIVRAFEGAPPVYADEQRARQILINILANAVKFTDKGRVTVHVTRQDGMVCFAISDTGIGIRREQYDLVFAEFQQVDSSTTRRHTGTGLGMAITRRLVEMHGGKIWLESVYGEGTTFFVTLPAADRVAGLPRASGTTARSLAQD